VASLACHGISPTSPKIMLGIANNLIPTLFSLALYLSNLRPNEYFGFAILPTVIK